MKGENLSGHCPGPRIHLAHQRQRQGERGQPQEAPKDRTEVLMSKGTLPLGNNYWKLIRGVKEVSCSGQGSYYEAQRGVGLVGR